MKNFIAILVLLLASNVSMASGRVVQCEIESGGEIVLSEKCRFNSAGNGSFYLSSIKKDQYLFNPIYSVSVDMTGDGVAEVSGDTGSNNSRWGKAIRSTDDEACWVGADFKVCAWSL